MGRRLACALLWLACCGVGVCAQAQAQTVSPSENQTRLYLAGAAAYEAGQHETAIAHFRAALLLGELNVVRLGLGRAMFATGDCDGAKLQYDLALEGPAVSSPTTAQVRAKVDEYRADLRAGCAGTLEIACHPEQMDVSVDGGEAQPCGRSWALPPGSHTVRGSDGNASIETVVHVDGAQTVRAELTLPATAPAPAPIESGADARLVWGAGLGGAGLVGLGLSVGIDVTVLNDQVAAYDRARTAFAANPTEGLRADAKTKRASADDARLWVLAGYGLSGALIATGATLAALALFGAEESRAETALSFRVSSDCGVVLVDLFQLW